MANRKISDLTALTAPATGDLLPIVDISEAAAADKNKKITFGELFASIPAGTEAAPSVAFEGDNTGIYSPGADQLASSTNGTERARIDSSGRLLVGTSTSTGVNATLQTVDDSNANPLELIASPNNDQGPNLNTAKARGSTASPTVVSSGDILGRWRFRGYDGSAYQIGAEIAVQVDGTPGANDMPGRLVFSTTADGVASPTERMTINSSGQIAVVGTSSAAAPAITKNNDLDTGFYFPGANSVAIATGGLARFDISSEGVLTGVSASSCLILSTTQGAGTGFTILAGKYGGTAGSLGSGTNSINIYSNGNIQNTNNSYGALSDLKLKENIAEANSQWDDLKALKIRKYNFKEGQTHTQIGLVAQEVELVSPGLVSESPDRDADGNDLGTVTKSVNYSVLYMKAVKTLQEAMERIEVLEQRLTDAGMLG